MGLSHFYVLLGEGDSGAQELGDSRPTAKMPHLRGVGERKAKKKIGVGGWTGKSKGLEPHTETHTDRER